MKPGRELDALVAEKVMGWKRLTYEQANPSNPHFVGRSDRTSYWHDAELKQQALAEDTYDYYSPEEAWSPSTDVAAAWEVAQKLADLDEDNRVEVHLYPTKYQECAVALTYFTNVDGEYLRVGPLFYTGDAAPHAICLAALKAVGAL